MRCAAVHDYLFTTGGIGPTHDDITVDAMAQAFGVPAVVHPAARKLLEDYYRDRPGGLTEARLRMARVPEGAELIANATSGAPGVRMGNVFILAGVPLHCGGNARGVDRQARGRAAGRLGHGRRARRRRATSPICCARPRPRTRAWRSAAIRSSRTADYGANFVIRSEDAELAERTGEQLAARLREAGYEPVEGGL